MFLVVRRAAGGSVDNSTNKVPLWLEFRGSIKPSYLLKNQLNFRPMIINVILYVLRFCLRIQIKQVWKEAPIEGGMLDYLKFVQIIKRGKEDE
jgi:hypothetical protein